METQSGIVELSASGSGGKSIFHDKTDAPKEGPKVFLKDGQVFANSRDVAEYFGKQHFHVMRDIDALVAMGDGWGSSNFGGTTYIHEQNKQEYRSYEMTKDGFTILAMGFNGPRALEFKKAYIQRFNEMEEFIKYNMADVQQFALPQTYSDALRALADKHERVQLLENEVSEVTQIKNQLHEQVVEQEAELADARNDVVFVRDFVSANGSINLADASKVFGMVPKAFTGLLF